MQLGFESNPREVLKRLQLQLREHPDLQPRYERVKELVRAFRQAASYEISTRCNLFCEGCYYFSRDADQPPIPRDARLPIERWQQFFADEAARGVKMAYFLGAEAALEQERLMAAVPHFRYGNIGTNGTIRIDPAIKFLITLSAWAGDARDEARLRGGAVLAKALRLYAGDPRAVVLMTVNRENLTQVRGLAQRCQDHGLRLSFNVYSPSSGYVGGLLASQADDRAYRRANSVAESPLLQAEDLLRIRQVLDDAIDEFPQTVAYSKVYNRWITEPGPRFAIGADGVAIGCHSRPSKSLHYYSVNLERSYPKCATESLDCSNCRMYSAGWSSRMEPGADAVSSRDALIGWLEMIESMDRIFFPIGDSPLRSGSESGGARAAVADGQELAA